MIRYTNFKSQHNLELLGRGSNILWAAFPKNHGYIHKVVITIEIRIAIIETVG